MRVAPPLAFPLVLLVVLAALEMAAAEPAPTERSGENLCHHALGWRCDKRIRETGPFTASFTTASGWQGDANGVHSAVVMYYSPELFAWLETNRAARPC